MRNVATFRRHVNLDDLDFGDDGVVETLKRVVGRRGLGLWRVERICEVEGVEGGKVVAESVERVGVGGDEGAGGG